MKPIQPAQLADYLSRSGWTLDASHPAFGCWRRERHGTATFVLVPKHTDFADYEHRVADTLRQIGSAEQRSPVWVEHDLRGFPLNDPVPMAKEHLRRIDAGVLPTTGTPALTRTYLEACLAEIARLRGKYEPNG